MDATEAERAVVGAVLQDPAMLGELHDLQVHHFHDEQVGQVFGMLRSLEAIDLVTVVPAALEMQIPASVVLSCKAPAAVNARHYAEIVREAWRKRVLKQEIERLTEKVDARPAWKSLADFALRTSALASDAGASSESYGDVWDEWFDDVTGIDDGGQLSWGIHALDEQIGPLRRGKLIVIAARPGMGKSAVAQQIGEAIAAQGVGVVFGQTEMSAREMLTRSVSRLTGIPLWRFTRRQLLSGHLEPIERARAQATALPFHVVDRPGLTVDALRAEAVRRGAGVVIVDYVQRLSGSSRKLSEYERVSEVSAACKDITRGGGPTVIALAQLSREIERRPPKERMPMASDLRSSGQIEQDADIILGILRPAAYDAEEDPHDMRVGVIKHREGVPGAVIRLHWNGETTSVKAGYPDAVIALD